MGGAGVRQHMWVDHRSEGFQPEEGDGQQRAQGDARAHRRKQHQSGAPSLTNVDQYNTFCRG
eukprot:3736005-Pyramimonas_sp.AAC.2